MSPVYPRACGGTRVITTLPPGAMGLSPRVRGNRAGIPVCNTAAGLSPRVRGTPIFYPPRPAVRRSIPARAGEPEVGYDLQLQCKSIPARAGGTSPSRSCQRAIRGLSPRVRGNRLGQRRLQRLGGSIPARAGEPRRTAHAAPGLGVYPRACGGTSGAGANALHECRSIPARAGEPLELGQRAP